MRKLSDLTYKQAVALLSGAGILLIIVQYSFKNTSFKNTSNSGQTDLMQETTFSSEVSPPNSFNPFDFTYIENNLDSLDQRDSGLITYTRVRHLTSPSKLPYNLKKPSNHSDGFAEWIARVFKNKHNGTFLEAGANDGERLSHTLYLEQELDWTGLLIECNPLVTPYLKSKHRKAWIADVCLSPTENPATLNFSNPDKYSPSGTLGKPWKLPIPFATNWTFIDVQAMPLYTVIAALGWTEIDYFSFDIEGQEFNVLRSFPFDLVTFKVIIIEVYFYSSAKRQELNDFLKSKGYIFHGKMQIDHVYYHESFQGMI